MFVDLNDYSEGIREEEFQQIVSQYSKLLYAVALSVLGRKVNSADIEEIVSDVFFRFWKHPEKFDKTKSSLKNYLVLMTKSMSFNKIKKNNRDYAMLQDDFPLEGLKAEPKGNAYIWDIFFQALMVLEEPARRICMERFFNELSPKKIAKECGLSLKEVSNKLYAGKKKIRKEMERLIFLAELEDGS